MMGKPLVHLIVILVLTAMSWADITHPQPAPTPSPAAKLVLLPTTIQINRDYDQRGSIGVRNDSDKPVTLRLTCQSPADLTCGFLATPSHARSMTLGAGQTQQVTLLIHANRARRRRNRIAVMAEVLDSQGNWQLQTRLIVPVTIAPAPLKLKTQWLESRTALGQARLSKTLRITNEGLDIPDFSITDTKRIAAGGNVILNTGALRLGKVALVPMPQHVVFQSHSSMDIEVLPRLTPSFLELGYSLYLHGQGQYVKVPYFISVPKDQEVYPSGLTRFTTIGSRGDFCIAQSTINYVFPDPVQSNPLQAWVLVRIIPQMILTQDKPLTLQVYFNGQAIGQITRQQLAGSFLFEVPTKAFTDNSSTKRMAQPDLVQLKFQNAAHDLSQFSSQVSLYIKHDPQPQYLTAKSAAAAKQWDEDQTDPMSVPVVIDNLWQMPPSVSAGDQIKAVLGLFNTSDISCPAGELVARMGKQIIGKTSYGTIQPFEKLEVKIQLTFPADMSKNESIKITAHLKLNR